MTTQLPDENLPRPNPAEHEAVPNEDEAEDDDEDDKGSDVRLSGLRV